MVGCGKSLKVFIIIVIIIIASTRYSIRFDESRVEHSITNLYHSIVRYLTNIKTSVVSSDHHGNHRVGDTMGVCVFNEERQTSHRFKHVFCKNAVTVIEDFRQVNRHCIAPYFHSIQILWFGYFLQNTNFRDNNFCECVTTCMESVRLLDFRE